MKSWLTALFFLCVSAVFLFFLMGRPARRVKSLPDREPPVDVPVFVQVPEPTGYDLGFERGYRAFLVQMGEDVASVELYASEVHGFSEDDVSRGYADGYHRACEMTFCPKNY